MDIFKALTHGDGTINEPNTTSFLFYLLANYRDTIGGGLFTWLLSKCDIDDCDEVDYDVEIEYNVDSVNVIERVLEGQVFLSQQVTAISGY